MYDCHSHTDFSGDCGTPPQEMILSALHKKMSGIAITDHVDYDYPHPEPSFEIDLDAHFDAINTLKKQVAEDIFVAIGLEIGYQPSCEAKASLAVQSKAYDFILCSIHTLQGADLYYGDFFTTRTPIKALTDYFEALTHMLDAFTDFDVIGHLDLPRRYHKPINALDFSLYQGALETLLKKVIEKDKAIEFNTSGYRYDDNSPYPTFDAAKLYFDLGGRKITLGSDAHRPEDIGHLFKETADVLKSIGFTEAYYYKQRKAIAYKL